MCLMGLSFSPGYRGIGLFSLLLKTGSSVFPKLEIIGNNLLGHLLQLPVIRNINYLDRSFHQGSNITAFRSRFKIHASVWATAITFGIGYDQVFSIPANLNF